MTSLFDRRFRYDFFCRGLTSREISKAIRSASLMRKRGRLLSGDATSIARSRPDRMNEITRSGLMPYRLPTSGGVSHVRWEGVLSAGGLLIARLFLACAQLNAYALRKSQHLTQQLDFANTMRKFLTNSLRPRKNC